MPRAPTSCSTRDPARDSPVDQLEGPAAAARELQREHLLSRRLPVADAGQRVRNVGVRSRGLGSERNKLALRVDFDRYTTGQRFLGLKSIVLDNLCRIGSFVAERVAMAFFDRVGAAGAARIVLPAVYQQRLPRRLRHRRSGRADFLARTLGENAGYLFSLPAIRAVLYGDYLGDDLASTSDGSSRRITSSNRTRSSTRRFATCFARSTTPMTECGGIGSISTRSAAVRQPTWRSRTSWPRTMASSATPR